MYMCPLLCTYSKQAAMMQEQENQKKSEDGQENQSTPSKESLERSVMEYCKSIM